MPPLLTMFWTCLWNYLNIDKVILLSVNEKAKPLLKNEGKKEYKYKKKGEREALDK